MSDDLRLADDHDPNDDLRAAPDADGSGAVGAVPLRGPIRIDDLADPAGARTAFLRLSAAPWGADGRKAA